MDIPSQKEHINETSLHSTNPPYSKKDCFISLKYSKWQWRKTVINTLQSQDFTVMREAGQPYSCDLQVKFTRDRKSVLRRLRHCLRQTMHFWGVFHIICSFPFNFYPLMPLRSSRWSVLLSYAAHRVFIFCLHPWSFLATEELLGLQRTLQVKCQM